MTIVCPSPIISLIDLAVKILSRSILAKSVVGGLGVGPGVVVIIDLLREVQVRAVEPFSWLDRTWPVEQKRQLRREGGQTTSQVCETETLNTSTSRRRWQLAGLSVGSDAGTTRRNKCETCWEQRSGVNC